MNNTPAKTEVVHELVIPDQIDDLIRQNLGRLVVSSGATRGVFYDRFNDSELASKLAKSSQKGNINRLSLRGNELVRITAYPSISPFVTPNAADITQSVFSELGIDDDVEAFHKRFADFKGKINGDPPELDLSSIGVRIPPGSLLHIAFGDMSDVINDFHGSRFDGIIDVARTFGYYMVERVMEQMDM